MPVFEFSPPLLHLTAAAFPHQYLIHATRSQGHFGTYIVPSDFNETSLLRLQSLDRYVTTSSALSIVKAMTPEPENGWVGWYDAHHDEASHFFRPPFPFLVTQELGYPTETAEP
jgi:hypothetical protein